MVQGTGLCAGAFPRTAIQESQQDARSLYEHAASAGLPVGIIVVASASIGIAASATMSALFGQPKRMSSNVMEASSTTWVKGVHDDSVKSLCKSLLAS